MSNQTQDTNLCLRRHAVAPALRISWTQTTILVIGVWLVSSAALLGQDDPQRGTARETAGWHLSRPGEDLESIARLYLGEDASGDSIARRNPGLDDLRPGDRVLVQLRAGLPDNGAFLSVVGGRVDAHPSPLRWLPGRRFDLLTEGDGLRTYSSSSAEMSFADSTRVVVTEDSLVFIQDSQLRRSAPHPGEIEIVVGQADLKDDGGKRKHEDTIEIVMGEARAQPKSDRDGALDARARRIEEGEAQLMVYRGSSRLEAAGTVVQIEEGEGSVILPGGPPSPPERLLEAPVLLDPTATARDERRVDLQFRWSQVVGAASYTFELCGDPDCSLLIEREIGIEETSREIVDVAGGHYYFRVTAASASGLDGFPSISSELTAIGEQTADLLPDERSVIVGSIRSGPDEAPLPGATVRVVERSSEVVSAADGTFEFVGLPAGRYTLEAAIDGVVVGRLRGVLVTPEHPTEAVILSDETLLIAHDEIDVRPSRVTLLGDAVPTIALSRAEIMALPHLGDDIFRALPLLPGTTTNDVTAQFHVRGGRRDEVQIVLDGQELYDAFHLKDLDNALSVVPSEALASVDLTTGGLPVEYGDRMGGLLDMRTVDPVAGHRTWVGISTLVLQAGGGGTFEEGRGSWLAVGRRGSIDLAGKVLGEENPRYSDVLVKSGYRLGNRQSLWVRGLVSDDALDFDEIVDGESKIRRTRQDGTYLWLGHQALVGTEMFVDTLVGWSDVHSNRRGQDLDAEQTLEVDDGRLLDVGEARQDWNLQVSSKHFLSWGLGLRRYGASFDYATIRRYDDLLAGLRTESGEEYAFEGSFSGRHSGAYVKDAARLSRRLMLEVGVRYDRQSWLEDEQVSPRLNLAYSIGEASIVRASWGHFYQSQRPYELQIQDAETSFSPVELSEERLLGFEHIFAPGSTLAGTAFRVEAYRREINDPRTRYENLYEPYNTYPELEPDRVRIEAERSSSQGVELFVRGSARKFGWWVNYGYATVEDLIDSRWVPRRIDQTHTLNLNLNVPLGRSWNLNWAWRYHTGWPTTPLGVEEECCDEDGESELVPALGPLNSERLSDYHRLDLRASRQWALSSGLLTFFVDIQNLYDRHNPSGFDITLDSEDGLKVLNEYWPGIFPSLGILWEF